MARFQLTAPHYINVENNEWEYKEVDRTTGKEKRHLRQVPRYLHPEDPSDWNYITERLPNGQISDGQIIVATKADSSFPKDIVFKGPPTMDMLPLDDEAKIMIAALQKKWSHPINDLSVGGFAEQLPMIWQQQLEAAKTQAPNISTKALEDLQRQNQDLQEKLAELTAVVDALAATTSQPRAESLSRRRPL